MNPEVAKWLKENAYAVKDGGYYFLPDFPDNETPERLEIPIKKRLWQEIKDNLG